MSVASVQGTKMITNNDIKVESNKLVTSIISRTNFIPKWFVSAHYKTNRSSRHNFQDYEFKIISESDAISKVEKNFKHLKNLLLCKVFNVSSANRIRCNKFRFLHFYEFGESKYNYHSHIIIEDIPNHPTLEDVESLLEAVQVKHKGIENSETAIDVKPIYSDGWVDYVLKTSTQYFNPLDLTNSDI
jgi:hypothetical protein